MKPTQEEKVLERLVQANGEWLHGDQVFLGEMRLRQYHRAIWNLEHNPKYQKMYSGKIEHSLFKDIHGFVSYRLITEPRQESLI